ncbi:uncharacterized protein LOC124911265 [Impatiens glandulifera]|uniref:uncharacterized protein LOC124911265 n=1 Tax=Impatiens glandulifera TaxID=253017 RepID=UPI001FB0BFA2|nr:uncharacterized protein LOC124911265 [Impatiens glandulifera]
MRNIAACYSDHAIKVSDSYCSGPSNRPYVLPNPPPSIREAVSSIYKAKLSVSMKQVLIKIIWCSLSGLGFTVSLCEGNPSSSSSSSPSSYSSRQLRKVKGSKKFESCNSEIEIIWDLSWAKYGPGPEPVSGYYIAIFIDSELGLLLGDMKEEIELTMEYAKFSIISRVERFSGNGGVYSTKARFSESGLRHEIMIRLFGEGLEVSVDKKRVMKVERLQWNFRGNETMFVDGMVVDMMWDVHDWLFKSSELCCSGSAVFMFRTRSGVDSRLWLDEKIMDHRFGFSLLICACKNPD